MAAETEGPLRHRLLEEAGKRREAAIAAEQSRRDATRDGRALGPVDRTRFPLADYIREVCLAEPALQNVNWEITGGSLFIGGPKTPPAE